MTRISDRELIENIRNRAALQGLEGGAGRMDHFAVDDQHFFVLVFIFFVEQAAFGQVLVEAVHFFELRPCPFQIIIHDGILSVFAQNQPGSRSETR